MLKSVSQHYSGWGARGITKEFNEPQAIPFDNSRLRRVLVNNCSTDIERSEEGIHSHKPPSDPC